MEPWAKARSHQGTTQAWAKANCSAKAWPKGWGLVVQAQLDELNATVAGLRAQAQAAAASSARGHSLVECRAFLHSAHAAHCVFGGCTFQGTDQYAAHGTSLTLAQAHTPRVDECGCHASFSPNLGRCTGETALCGDRKSVV